MTEVDGRLTWSSPKDHQRRSVPFLAFLSEVLAARRAGKAAGRPVVVRLRNELRHTAASMAVSAGASVLAFQRMLGHDKPSTTLDVYSDLFEVDLDDVAQRLSEARARARKANLRPTLAESTHSTPPAGR